MCWEFNTSRSFQNMILICFYIHYSNKLHWTTTCFHYFIIYIYPLCLAQNPVDLSFTWRLKFLGALCSWLSFMWSWEWKNEPICLKKAKEREKEGKRREDKLQLVQEVRMMPVEGMRAIHRAFSQETSERTHTHTHPHTWHSEARLSRHVVVRVLCVFASVIRRLKMETEDVEPSLSLCLHSV